MQTSLKLDSSPSGGGHPAASTSIGVSTHALALVVAVLSTLLSSDALATEVTFRFRPEGQVVTVSVAGYFNEWSISASPLADPDGDGLWEMTADLSPGMHPYKFVVDGSEWITDASAPEFEDDGFGGKNSVLIVEDAPLVVEGVPADPSLEEGGAIVPRDTAVRFRYRPDAGAEFVSVAGSFNDWSTSASPMRGPDHDGVYETVFRLPRGRYLYKFVVDGNQWLTDETAAAFEDDGFGGQNSVLEVGGDPLVVGEPIPGEESVASVGPLVTFRFAPERRRIHAISLAGSFNDWDAAAHPMSDVDGDGVWVIRFRLPPGEHSYQFVIDGDDWTTDPFSEVYEDDGFGGRNARFTLGREDVEVGSPN